MTETTAKDVAEWMRRKVHEQRELYQEDAATDIGNIFGNSFVYENENGNLAIDKTVLNEFRKLTEQDVVWERGYRLWRLREAYDPPGQRQADE